MAKTTRPPGSTPESKQPKPYGKWLGYGAAAVVVVGVIVVMLNAPQDIPDERPDGVEEIAVADRSHVEGAVSYDRNPPAGGPHSATPLTCGVYEFAVPFENTVHSLEHGAVWITYLPDIGDSAIGDLESAARLRSKTILSPNPGQAAPVIATAWGFQLELQDASDIRLRQFVQQFESADTAPEPGASCIGVTMDQPAT